MHRVHGSSESVFDSSPETVSYTAPFSGGPGGLGGVPPPILTNKMRIGVKLDNPRMTDRAFLEAARPIIRGLGVSVNAMERWLDASLGTEHTVSVVEAGHGNGFSHGLSFVTLYRHPLDICPETQGGMYVREQEARRLAAQHTDATQLSSFHLSTAVSVGDCVDSKSPITECENYCTSTVGCTDFFDYTNDKLDKHALMYAFWGDANDPDFRPVSSFVWMFASEFGGLLDAAEKCSGCSESLPGSSLAGGSASRALRRAVRPLDPETPMDVMAACDPRMAASWPDGCDPADEHSNADRLTFFTHRGGTAGDLTLDLVSSMDFLGAFVLLEAVGRSKATAMATALEHSTLAAEGNGWASGQTPHEVLLPTSEIGLSLLDTCLAAVGPAVVEFFEHVDEGVDGLAPLRLVEWWFESRRPRVGRSSRHAGRANTGWVPEPTASPVSYVTCQLHLDDAVDGPVGTLLMGGTHLKDPATRSSWSHTDAAGVLVELRAEAGSLACYDTAIAHHRPAPPPQHMMCFTLTSSSGLAPPVHQRSSGALAGDTTFESSMAGLAGSRDSSEASFRCHPSVRGQIEFGPDGRRRAR